jgi:hypothetical protein
VSRWAQRLPLYCTRPPEWLTGPLSNGRSTEYVRLGDEGSRSTFHFCPACGATIYYQIDDMPDVTVIPVGAFADPTFPAPRVSVYEARRHAWVSIPADAEHID